MHISFKNQNITTLNLEPDPRLKKVSSIDISNNKIVTLEVDAFICFSSLTHLELSHNLIRELPYHWPSTLQYLNVGFNRLTHIGGLESCSELDTLLMPGNQISSLKGLGGSMSNRLRVLDVSQNNITSLDFNPKCAGALKILNVSKNNIQMIEDIRVLARLRLKELWLQHNPISIRTTSLQSVVIGLIPCLERFDGHTIEMGEMGQGENPATYLVNFEKIRNKRKEESLNKSLSGGRNQNFSFLENSKQPFLEQNVISSSHILHQMNTDSSQYREPENSEEYNTDINSINEETTSNVQRETTLTFSPNRRQTNISKSDVNKRKTSSQSKMKASHSKERDQSNTFIPKPTQKKRIDSSNLNNTVSIVEMEELKSENEQLRSMIQNLRHQIAVKDEVINKRNEDLKKNESIIQDLSRTLSQEKLSNRQIRIELQQIQKELRRIKKTDALKTGVNSNRYDTKSSPVKKLLTSPQKRKSSFQEDNTSQLNNKISELQASLEKKDVKIAQLKDKMKVRALETKRDMDQLMKYVSELHGESTVLDRNSNNSINFNNISELKDQSTALTMKQDQRNRRESLETSATLEEAENIANEILKREFSGELPYKNRSMSNANEEIRTKFTSPSLDNGNLKRPLRVLGNQLQKVDRSNIKHEMEELDSLTSALSSNIDTNVHSEELRKIPKIDLHKTKTQFVTIPLVRQETDSWSESNESLGTHETRESDNLMMVSAINPNNHEAYLETSYDEPFLSKVQGLYSQFNYNSLSPMRKIEEKK